MKLNSIQDTLIMDQKRKEKTKSMGGNDSQGGLRTSLEDIPEESGSSAGDPNFKDNRSSRVNMISRNSVGRNSWEEEEDDDDDDDDWEASRRSFREGRAVPSGRQVLSRGKVSLFCLYGYHIYNRVCINRVRLPILLVVS